MFEILKDRAGLTADASMVDVVAAVHRMPYGRPAVRSVEGALAEWRGTCSTKHALLAAVFAERWPESEPRLVHRVYRCTPELAQRSFGAQAASAVPAEGLWDVHRYLTVDVDGRRVVVDVTFPSGPSWDGAATMPLACGPGTDHVVDAGGDADADKRALEREWCDPAVREPFIAALPEG
ncbi:hypothetical protein [Streptacidiphilus jiangxiensis]|uniref:Transglutaminase-like superfamily protein n=1 Tax=Streptacidiphilus jiangxiensis TaxID=235985 RepID=A0A1H7SAA9_STRJI|nr:hypothetical protein [Streptacidiphilus jiangxiensis]SEL69550.1 hypothetical protein SAMN05414137_111260 [Streptacidiphilus jiangxiensis]